MSNLLKEDSQDNLGSLVEINFIDVKDIDIIPDPIGINLYDPVVLKTDKTWSLIQVSQETPGFDEESNYSQSGTGLNISVKGFIPGHNDVLESRLQSMLRKKFVLVVSDFEGRKRIIGTLKNPLRFKWSFSTGNRTNSRKGYDIQFFHTAAKSPLFYQSALASVSEEEFDPNADSYLAALEARVSDLETEILTKQDSLGFTPENAAYKNQNNGYPGLDSSGLILVAQLQAIISDATSTATNKTWSIDKIKSSILALINDTLSSGNANTWSIDKINTAISTAINNLLNGAGPAYDTLKELQDLIVNDETTASALAATVATKEPSANKATNFNTINDTLFPTTKAVNDKFLDQSGTKVSATLTGTNSYSGTISPAITSYANSQRWYLKFTNSSTGLVTCNLNTIGSIKVFKNPTTQADSGDIVANQIYLVAYDSTLDSGSGGFLIIGGLSAVKKLTLNFDTTVDTFLFTQDVAYKITSVVADTGVTAVIKLHNTATNYTLGSAMSAYGKLDISVSGSAGAITIYYQ
jgi:hypothetical protein